MNKIALFALVLLTASAGMAQKKDKIKGSRVVTAEAKEIGDFENVEVGDNIEVFLEKGDRCALEIEADDNTHDAIAINSSAGTLRISTTQDVTSTKKFSVKITYTDGLRMFVAKNDVQVTALTDMLLPDFTFKAFGNARIYATVKAKTFTLMENDRARAELNVTSENAALELNKSSQLKALVSAMKLKLDMYEKSIATMEGDAGDVRLRMDGNTNLTAKNLTAKNADITAEGNANLSMAVTGVAGIQASGKAEIDLHGDQAKIEIRKFADQSIIRKKPLK
jgi:hypothetical protein